MVAMKKASGSKKASKKASKKGPVAVRMKGKTTGKGLTEYRVQLLVENEARRKASKKPWTDEAMADMVRKEFPGHDSNNLSPAMTQAFRNNYNTGRFNEGVAPKLQSKRYGEDGQVLERRPREASEAKPAKKASAKKAASKPAKKAAKAAKPAATTAVAELSD